jgi:hypothetical protein
VVAGAQPAPPRLQRRSCGSFAAILGIAANHIRSRTHQAAATNELIADGRKPNCGREQMAFADRTPSPQAAATVVERLAVKLQAAVRGRLTVS